MPRIAFQGEPGAFSEDAVIEFFKEAESLPCRRLADVFEAVYQGQAHFGMVPVENSQAGSINETYDLLLHYTLNIYGEVDLEVSHCLAALPGETLESIQKVFSHPQALAQCDEFLRRLGAEVVPTYDTAGSARMIKEQNLAHCAAVASRRAAQMYGLKLLAERIQTYSPNRTKFFVLSREKAQYGERSQTSLIFAVKNAPGALYASLGAFATRNINLTKLQSRPSKDKPWEFIFYVDFDGHMEDEVCRQALADLGEKTAFLKVLGSYPKSGEGK